MPKEMRLKSPFEVETPKGCEGWEEMYPKHLLFSQERRQYDESKLWTYDAVHHAGVMSPFDIIIPEQEQETFSWSGDRSFPIPTAHGTDYRVLNGYVYVSPNDIKDPELINRRLSVFLPRQQFITENFDALFHLWKNKMAALCAEVLAIDVPHLTEFEPESTIWNATGLGCGYRLLQAYMNIMNCFRRSEQYHMEIVMGAYGNYMALADFVMTRVPDMEIPSAGKLCTGGIYDVLIADIKLKELAQLALELKVDKELQKLFEKGVAPEQIMAELRKDKAGLKWVEQMEKDRYPWFYLVSGTGGFTHNHVAWNDDLRIPFEALLSYVSLLREGRKLGRPREELLAERDALADEVRSKLAEEDRGTFNQMLGAARKVYPYIEGHPFYCEHWAPALIWNKLREVGSRLVEGDFLKDKEDIFYLNAYEIWPILQDMVGSWSATVPPQGPRYLPAMIERRKGILKRLSEWAPPIYLGKTPESVTEPVMVLVWGTTTEKVQNYLAELAGAGVGVKKGVRGLGGSTGVVEGRARVIMSLDQAGELKVGEILVAPSTMPSWTPLFSKIKGVVVEVGGMMAHAAIIAREYGMPAVVGAHEATQIIKTGDLLRIDGGKGVVDILERAKEPAKA